MWAPARLWYYTVFSSTKNIFRSFVPSHTGKEMINAALFVQSNFSVSLFSSLDNRFSLYIQLEHLYIRPRLGICLPHQSYILLLKIRPFFTLSYLTLVFNNSCMNLLFSSVTIISVYVTYNTPESISIYVPSELVIISVPIWSTLMGIYIYADVWIDF